MNTSGSGTAPGGFTVWCPLSCADSRAVVIPPELVCLLVSRLRTDRGGRPANTDEMNEMTTLHFGLPPLGTSLGILCEVLGVVLHPECFSFGKIFQISDVPWEEIPCLLPPGRPSTTGSPWKPGRSQSCAPQISARFSPSSHHLELMVPSCGLLNSGRVQSATLSSLPPLVSGATWRTLTRDGLPSRKESLEQVAHIALESFPPTAVFTFTL